MRHVLTVKERLKGVEAALRSRKTPSHFRPGLEVQRHELRRRLRDGHEGRQAKRHRKASGRLVDWLDLQ